jgi:hypothetical protein
MNRQPREVYGFGTRIPTRTGPFVRLARWTLAAAILTIVLLQVSPW